MRDLRLGDIIDDFCIKCRRLTNHAIVSLMSGAAAKVRCRTCYSDHDYRNEQAPPTKKELQKQKELYDAVLAGVTPATVEAPIPEPAPAMEEASAEAVALPSVDKTVKKASKKKGSGK